MIIYIDMDGVLCDYHRAFTEARLNNPAVRKPQSQAGFFTALAPLPGGREAAAALFAHPTFKPYILTAPSQRNPHSYAEKRIWIENHLGYHFVNRLIISPHKGLLRGDVLIDDNRYGSGQNRFVGRFIHFGSEGFPDWAAVRADLQF